MEKHICTYDYVSVEVLYMYVYTCICMYTVYIYIYMIFEYIYIRYVSIYKYDMYIYIYIYMYVYINGNFRILNANNTVQFWSTGTGPPINTVLGGLVVLTFLTKHLQDFRFYPEWDYVPCQRLDPTTQFFKLEGQKKP